MKLVYLKHTVKLVLAWLNGSTFWNYRLYKKFGSSQRAKGEISLKYSGSFAIVMQGPIISDSNFTFETLRIYKNNFPQAILILSTWAISVAERMALEEINVHVIENEKPKYSGIGNINLQIVTSRIGILEAQKLGADYVLKTRSDQRICHPSLDAYLFSLLHFFPLSKDISCQRYRLVGASLNWMKFRLYGVSDMFLFGHVEDMLLYWNVDLDERPYSQEMYSNDIQTWREHAKLCVSEVYLSTAFIKKIGRELLYTLADSFDVLGKHFLIIDKDAIQIYWHKYTINMDRYTNFNLSDAELSFNDWLILYSSPKSVVVDESILDQPISLSSR